MLKLHCYCLLISHWNQERAAFVSQYLSIFDKYQTKSSLLKHCRWSRWYSYSQNHVKNISYTMDQWLVSRVFQHAPSNSDNDFYLPSFKNLNGLVWISRQHTTWQTQVCSALYQSNSYFIGDTQYFQNTECYTRYLHWKFIHLKKNNNKNTLCRVPIFNRVEQYKSFLVVRLENWAVNTEVFLAGSLANSSWQTCISL